MIRRLNTLLFAVVLFGGFAMAGTPPAYAAGLPQNSRGMPSLAPLIKKAMPAVVNISTTGIIKRRIRGPFMNPLFQQFFGTPPNQTVEQPFISLGTGVIVNAAKGYILTNYHVIRDAKAITVTLYNKQSYKAKVIGVNKNTDLAVIRIRAQHLIQLPIGDSGKMQVGDFVIAIGEPLGLKGTATFGIISAAGRTPALGPFGSYDDFIQTDAAINPGNSGGPLINMDGKMIGINTAIATSGRSRGNIGIGFAIPSDITKVVMEQLIKYGKVEGGVLGVEVQDLNPSLAKQFKLKPGMIGALIAQVIAGSAAAKAGLKQGDVIIEVNGHQVKSANMLRNYIGIRRVGTPLQLVLYRNGKRRVIDTRIGPKTTSSSAEAGGHGPLGATFSNLTRNLPLYGKIQGVVVTSVAPNGQAAKAGLQPGDIIIAIKNRPLRNLAEFNQALSTYKGTLLLTVRRGNAMFFTTIR